MASRTLFAWLFIAVLLAVGIFFTYHILLANNEDPKEYEVIATVKEYNNVPEMVIASAKPIKDKAMIAQSTTEVVEPLRTPTIPAQTQQDVKETRQVSETPPTVRYAEPEAVDTLEGPVHMESEFGDNLRHPEQTIEIMPPMGSQRVAINQSGLGADHASLGGNQGISYGPEMGQNGGEFMQGIFAYDGSDGGGIGYSMI
jgi:hypothetical protein